MKRTSIATAALLLAGSAISAQVKVSMAPPAVNLASPQRVLLRITKADGSSDSEQIRRITSIIVDDKPTKPEPLGAEPLTFVPPRLDVAGTKTVRLLDGANQEIARGSLDYAGQSARPPASDAPRPRLADEDIRKKEQARRDALADSSWYYILVSLMFAAVLIPFVMVIYRGTAGSQANDSRPLGFPVGSFRSILAYSLVAYVGFYVLTSILSVSQFAPPDFLLGIAATVIGFYFGSRSGEDRDKAAKAASVRGTVRLGTNPVRGAIVRFRRSADGVEPYSRITDAEGRFELAGAAPGTYAVQATVAGAAPSPVVELTLSDGADHDINIAMAAAS